MACFKYQAYLYGSEAVTYLNALLRMVKEPALWVVYPIPTTGQPSPFLYISITFIDIEGNSSMV